MKIKNILSIMIASLMIYMGTVPSYAQVYSYEDGTKVSIHGSLKDGNFTERVYTDDKEIVFNHSVDNSGNRIIEIIEDKEINIIKYDEMNNEMFLNNVRLDKFVDDVNSQESNVASIIGGDKVVVAGNVWELSGTVSERWFIQGLTVGVIAATLAVFTGGAAAIFLGIAGFLAGGTLWMSAEKDMYMCYNYNGTYKVAFYHTTRVYADRHWSDQVHEYTTPITVR